MKIVIRTLLIASLVSLFISAVSAQEQPPAPSAPKAVSVPSVVEKKLPNGLTVALVQRTATPIVTIQLLIKCGASCEGDDQAGLADMTASMLTKGTKTRTATQIAEDVEFLGGSIGSGASWNSSFVSLTVTSDKVAQAMAILSDVVLNPKFDDKELELLRSQTLDGLTYNLKQPSFLANYVASKYSFGEHPANGTPTSISAIKKSDIANFYSTNFKPEFAVLIVTGDITSIKATSLANSSLGKWKGGKEMRLDRMPDAGPNGEKGVKRILVVDLPKSGQAAVNYAKPLPRISRSDLGSYYQAQVLNSVLGGGYSSRLNYEIRIKRGLSYGAGSSFAWRSTGSNFATRVQTKNESAAQVAELTMAEIGRLTSSSVANDELVPRKSVLTGGFGRNLETTAGLANALGDLYAFGIETSELNKYVAGVNGVSDSQIRDFASRLLLGGDIIIVGDYSIFKDDLAKRFPGIMVDVIKADDIDLSKPDLRK